MGPAAELYDWGSTTNNPSATSTGRSGNSLNTISVNFRGDMYLDDTGNWVYTGIDQANWDPDSVGKYQVNLTVTTEGEFFVKVLNGYVTSLAAPWVVRVTSQCPADQRPKSDQDRSCTCIAGRQKSATSSEGCELCPIHTVRPGETIQDFGENCRACATATNDASRGQTVGRGTNALSDCMCNGDYYLQLPTSQTAHVYHTTYTAQTLNTSKALQWSLRRADCAVSGTWASNFQMTCKCQPCVTGADCNIDTANTTMGVQVENMPIKAGFWRTNRFSVVVKKCKTQGACTGRTSSDYDALETYEDLSLCHEGNTGPYCEVCRCVRLLRQNIVDLELGAIESRTCYWYKSRREVGNLW